jgi:hypothetical protein
VFTIITQIRNEEKRLKDWIKYHSKLGISEFIIYCDNTTDGSKLILESLKEKYNIKIFESIQFGIYTDSQNPYDYRYTDAAQRIENSYKRGLDHIREKLKDLNHWSIFTEVDEYIVPQTDLGLDDFVKLVPNGIHRIYMASYDFKCPFDLDKPVYEQTYLRWSEDTRKNGTANGVKGWFRNRGKSMVRSIDCITNKVAIHDIDNSPYYQNDKLMLINHYRNFGEMQIYDYEDKKIMNWL